MSVELSDRVELERHTIDTKECQAKSFINFTMLSNYTIIQFSGSKTDDLEINCVIKIKPPQWTLQLNSQAVRQYSGI